MKQKFLLCLLFAGLFLGLGLNALAANVWGWAWMGGEVVGKNLGWLSMNRSNFLHWTLVDDVIADDYDTYVWTDSGVEEKDAYQLQNPTGIIGTEIINQIRVKMRYQGKITTYLRLNGVESSFPGSGSIVGAWGDRTTSWQPSRPGGGSWTWSDINNLQVVIGLQSVTLSGNTYQGRLTQVYVEVEHSGGTLILRPDGEGDYTNIANPPALAGQDYGVHICTSDTDPNPRCAEVASPKQGKIVGYAWAGAVEDTPAPVDGTIGWIRFDPPGPYPTCPVTTCPGGSPNYSSRVDLGTKKVTGWARACAGTVNGDCVSATRTDGWDGWILLGPIVKGGTDYGSYVDTSTSPAQFRMWAWGSDVVGWISFNKSNCDSDGNGFVDVACGGDNTTTAIANYKVMTDLVISVPSSATDLNAKAIYGCGTSPIVRFSWTYSGSSSQSAYEIQIDDDPNLDEDPLATLTGGADNSRDYALLSYNTDYWWRLKVRDSNNQWSGWIYPDPLSFNTGSRWPVPDFDWDPPDPIKEKEVQFNNLTQLCGAGGCSWNWNFDDGNSSTAENPIHTFDTEGTYNVKLTATNILGSCERIKSLGVGVAVVLPRPRWREIAPTFY